MSVHFDHGGKSAVVLKKIKKVFSKHTNNNQGEHTNSTSQGVVTATLFKSTEENVNEFKLLTWAVEARSRQMMLLLIRMIPLTVHLAEPVVLKSTTTLVEQVCLTLDVLVVDDSNYVCASKLSK